MLVTGLSFVAYASLDGPAPSGPVRQAVSAVSTSYTFYSRIYHRFDCAVDPTPISEELRKFNLLHDRMVVSSLADFAIGEFTFAEQRHLLMVPPVSYPHVAEIMRSEL